MVKLIQGNYEKAKKHYEKSGKCDYFEFHLAYTPTNETFREIDRFLWESRHQKTRYRNRYEGPVLIDLSSWNGKETNTYFDAFMYFLKDNSSFECTFIVQKQCSAQMEQKLESFFKIKKTVLEQNSIPSKRTIGFDTEGKEDEYVRI